MITKVEYKIRFPFQSIFSQSPKFLFMKGIYGNIKQMSCLSDGKCKECIMKDNCIFYKISGYNFHHSEGLVIEMNPIEQTSFKKNSVFNVTFYLIGSMNQYIDFIHEYFKYHETIENNYFQKNLNSVEVINNKYIDGIYEIDNKFNIDCINEEIDFINKEYELNLDNNFNIEIINENKANNYIKYYINGRLIKYNGFSGKVKLTNYPSIITHTGIGSSMVISGGKMHENKN